MAYEKVDKCGLRHDSLRDGDADTMGDEISAFNTPENVRSENIALAFVLVDACIEIHKKAVYKKPTKGFTEKMTARIKNARTFFTYIVNGVENQSHQVKTEIVNAVSNVNDVLPIFKAKITTAVSSITLTIIKDAIKALESIKTDLETLGLDYFYDQIHISLVSYKSLMAARTKAQNSNKSTKESKKDLTNAFNTLVDAINNAQDIAKAMKDNPDVDDDVKFDHTELAKSVTGEYRKYAAIIASRKTRNGGSDDSGSGTDGDDEPEADSKTKK